MFDVKNIPLQTAKIITVMINVHAVLRFWGHLCFDRSFLRSVCWQERLKLSSKKKKNQVQLETIFLISYSTKGRPLLIPDWDSQARCVEIMNNNSTGTRLHQLAAKARRSWVAGCCPLQAVATNRRSSHGFGGRRHRSSPGTAGFITPPHHFHPKAILGHLRLN